MHPLDTGLAPTPLLVAPAPVEWRLAWGEWVGLACLGAALFVACFCGSYELKTALVALAPDEVARLLGEKSRVRLRRPRGTLG